MGDAELKITYETLFEILRREKDKKELQKLDSDFFNNVQTYFKEKKQGLLKLNNLSEEEFDALKSQITNAQSIFKRIFDTRERKIIDKAIIKAMTKSDIVDTNNMLEEEKEFFNKLVELLSKNREKTFNFVFNNKKETQEESQETRADEQKTSTKQQTEKQSEEKTVIARFIAPVPKFVGLDGKIYGPFSEEEIATLPLEIANILLDKEKIEIINPEDEDKNNEKS